MTETCSQVALSRVRPGSEGQAYREMFPTSMRVSAKEGEVGEIVVDGPTVASGYWRNARATKAAFREDGFHTGDLGREEAGGGLVVLGRAEDTIMSGGEKIYPAEVESSLLEHPAVREAVVLGMDDPRWGQRTEAVVVLKAGKKAPDEAELKSFLAKRFGRYKIPKAFHYWEGLPVTSTGKTKTQAVRAALERRKGG